MLTDARDSVCLELLVRLVYPHGFPKNCVFVKCFEVGYHYVVLHFVKVMVHGCVYN